MNHHFPVNYQENYQENHNFPKTTSRKSNIINQWESLTYPQLLLGSFRAIQPPKIHDHHGLRFMD